MNWIKIRLKTGGILKLTAARLILAGTFLSISSGVASAAEPITTRGNQVLYGGVAMGYAGNSLFWSNTGWVRKAMLTG